MFEELGEPIQVLTPDSERPLVVHRLMGQLTLVTRESGFASLQGETLTIRLGDLLILAPGCEHSFLCPVGEQSFGTGTGHRRRSSPTARS